MKPLPQISDAEFEVMNVIWKYAPINTNDIIQQISREKSWNPKTIQTMIFRLEKKGVLTHEKEGRIFVYSPLIQKESYLEIAKNTFINRFFDGAFNQMVVNYLSKHELTDKDIDDLQKILDKKRK
ncbi:BlaI/MecI/CopY family transcriptional regulator [Anaerotignum propionicum]|uniref:BlaI/MecI/CopY family transcriptional regulator n=1 Tax=Anaerotignum propionicum TaxID=28446 RepID=UPI0028978463|nr:BlaI/MecI/CopY family transcriptional regulator [Anaerotignum propionicum]MEA4841980.1 BlaI/MecI/CopY family transcriptional regulator [[Clostridium] symbiosum]